MTDKMVNGFVPGTAVSPAGSPYADGSPVQSPTNTALTAATETFLNDGPSPTLNLVKKMVNFVVDYTDIAAVQTAYLGPVIPAGSQVIRSYYKVTQTFTSGGADAATIGIGFNTDDAAGIVAATAISAGGNIWDAEWHNGIQDGTLSTVVVGNVLTEDRQVEFLRGGGQVLTGGRFILFLEYVGVS